MTLWPVSAATLAMVVATLAIVAMPGTDSCAGNVYPGKLASGHPALVCPTELETGEWWRVRRPGSGELRPGADTGHWPMWTSDNIRHWQYFTNKMTCHTVQWAQIG